ncbi:MAG TPA: hypothetical protein EYQ86_05920 [Bacteroidetes bacterium]|nr:hypothetical protein [Bacteroidota bacterium]
MTLEDDLDVSRGDIISKEGNMPETTQDIDVMVCWLNKKPLLNKGKYTIQHTSKKARCLVNEVYYKVDINTLHRMDEDLQVNMNDIAKVRLRITEPLFVDRYQRNRNTGSLILVDEASNVTVGACMII